MAHDILKIMTRSPVIPVMVIREPSQAVPLAQALYKGGLAVLEITLRTAHGLDAIRNIRDALPGACVGAGTVTTPNELEAAVKAGAQFLVSPGYTSKLIDAAACTNIPVLPGIATPGEAMGLMEKGIAHMKFFPAEAAGGISMLKALLGPLPGIMFCPTGGITLETAPDYLALPNVACVGGSWMVPQQLIDAGDWDGIEALALEAGALKSSS
jgi:2-dehydro-3-deoxyphosphogluconate aldolase / (4S)-4-hydroxy-2-oxoglutarate aldolase